MGSKETQLPPPWSALPSALQAQLLLAPQYSPPEGMEASLELSPFSGSQGASERRGILWRWRGPSGLRWVWRNGRGKASEMSKAAGF